MDISVVWTKPLPIKWTGTEYEADWETIPSSAGVYIIGRQYGKTMEALYVGQTGDLNRRIERQLNNLKLMHHVEESSNGGRIVLAGAIKTKSKKKIKTHLNTIERALIRHFIAEGHDLANKRGAPRLKHTIESTGAHPKKWWPKKLSVEA